jgi:sulfur carrier protein ThiS
MVKINYHDVDAAGMTVKDYVNTRTMFDLNTVAVVINNVSIPLEDRGKVTFQDGDVARIYSFRAGG